jgi:transcriptional regulator
MSMGKKRPEVLQGTLDLMVLKTIEAMGPLHGYGIARRIEEVSGGEVSGGGLRLNQGTIHPALERLQKRGWIRAEWGVSASGRRARFYALTPLGREGMARESAKWKEMAEIMTRFLGQEIRSQKTEIRSQGSGNRE